MLQQLRLFNAHYDDYGFQPIVVFDGDGRFVTAVLRPAKRPKGVEIRAFLRRLVRAIRGNWPQVAILVRADSHYACPEVLDWCEANGLDYILGLAPTSTLKRHVGGLEASTSARFKADSTAGKVSRFKEFHDAAGSWSRVRRIVARVEAGGDGTDTRFIVTNLGHGNGRSLYQDLYCRRGQAENHVWTPPGPQALSSSYRRRWSAAAMYPAFSAATGPAGLDEIRGSAPDYQVELEALWFSRVLPTHGPTVVPSRRRSPSQLAEACDPPILGVMDCSLPFLLRAD